MGNGIRSGGRGCKVNARAHLHCGQYECRNVSYGRAELTIPIDTAHTPALVSVGASHPTAGLAALARHSSTDLEELIQGAAAYAQGVVSENTKRGYAREFARFKEWADEHGLPSLPTTPEVVAVYLGALASGKVSVRWAHGGKTHETMEKKTVGTIDRAHQGIVFAQREAGYEWMSAHPLIVRVMRGVRRTLGVKRKQVAALRLEELRLLCGSAPRISPAAATGRCSCSASSRPCDARSWSPSTSGT